MNKWLWFLPSIILLIALLYIALSTTSVVTFVFGPGATLQKDEGRVNVLLLGMAGGRHDGATLTDTIIVTSYNPKNHQVDLIAIPRDLWVEKHQAKVNTFYQTGLAYDKGLEFARNEIGQILGIKIPYAVRVDFSGFVKAIDLAGGIYVKVEKPFDDYLYPIDGKEKDLCGYSEMELEVDEDKSRQLNIPVSKQKILKSPEGKIATDSAKLEFPCRYEHISFKQGLISMDGETALKFSRSRNGTNNEGTDFARSRRQQLVLRSFKDKVLSLETLFDPRKVVELIKTFGDSVETDIPQAKYLEFVALLRNIDKVRSFVLDTGGDNPLLVTPPPENYGTWVVIPQNNDFSKIHQFVDNIFSSTNQR